MASPLFPLMQKFVQDEAARIESQQVTPWASFYTHFGKICADFHGSEISSGGMEYSGSIQERFWRGYIEPFLEDLTCRAYARARELAKERNLGVKPALEETCGQLVAATRKIYARMAEIDQRLRGKGDPRSVARYSPDDEVAAMERFIARHLASELASLRGLRGVEDVSKRYPLLFKATGAAIAVVVALLIAWALIPTSEGKLRGVELLERVVR